MLFLTFPVLVWLIDGAGRRPLRRRVGGGRDGWWFGFGYFLVGLYWLGHAFLVDADIFAWLLPFAVIGLPAGLAIFFAIGFALARLIWTRGAVRVLALAAALTIAEWLRGHLLTGFPWNALGYALTGRWRWRRPHRSSGIWGLTFIAVAVFAAPAALADERADSFGRWLTLALARRRARGDGGFGTVAADAHADHVVDGIRLRIMQPNLQQDVKFNYSPPGIR